MTESRQPHLPIGYWAKKAADVLTVRINEVQQTLGLARTEWQILNSLHEAESATGEQLAEWVRPFADAAVIDAAVLRLTQQGLIEEIGSRASRFQLTKSGQELHQTALSLQKEVRQQAVKDISEPDYLTTVRVLQQLVENLEGNAAQQATPAACS